MRCRALHFSSPMSARRPTTATATTPTPASIDPRSGFRLPHWDPPVKTQNQFFFVRRGAAPAKHPAPVIFHRSLGGRVCAGLVWRFGSVWFSGVWEPTKRAKNEKKYSWYPPAHAAAETVTPAGSVGFWRGAAGFGGRKMGRIKKRGVFFVVRFGSSGFVGVWRG